MSQNSLGRKILIRILLASSLFTLLITSIEFVADVMHGKQVIEKEVGIANESASEAIARSLWMLEEDILQAQLVGLARIPYIEKVEVFDETLNVSYAQGDIRGRYYQNFKFPIENFSGHVNELKKLGFIEFTITYDNLYAESFRALKNILFSQGLKIFCMSFLILFFLKELVLNDLSIISDFLKYQKSYGSSKTAYKPLNLKRRSDYDEISLLESEFNSLQQRVQNDFLTLREHKASLEKAIGERVAMEEIAHNQCQLSLHVLNAIRDPLFLIERNGRILIKNIAANDYFGVEGEVDNFIQTMETSAFELAAEGNEGLATKNLLTMLDSDEALHFSGFCQTVLGKRIPVRVSIESTVLPEGGAGRIVTFADQSETEELKLISYNANHDSLTGLLSRHYFNVLLEDSLSVESAGQVYTLVFLDLDNFKNINDVFGHFTGDMALKEIAQQIQQVLKPNDYAARFGGDEFNIFLQCNIALAVSRMEQFLSLLSGISLGGHCSLITFTASIGLTEIKHGDSVEDAMLRANEAAHEIKKNGGAGLSVYQYSTAHEVSEQQLSDHYLIIQKTKEAILNKGLCLYYQEIMPISKQNSLSARYEILTRFLEGDNIVEPQHYLSITDQYNMTPKVDLWVIKTLTNYIVDNQVSMRHLNLNLSSQSVFSGAVQEAILVLLGLCQQTGHDICFELTEDVMMKNMPATQAFINLIRQHGGQFALGGVDSGFTSQGVIKALNFDMLKIDGALIEATEYSQQDRDLVDSIRKMAVSMEVLTVAQHTPNTHVFDWLKELGIDYSQAYIHSYPARLV